MQLCYHYTLKLNQIQIFLTYVYIQVSYFLNAVTKPPSYPLADKFFTLCSAKFLSLNDPAITPVSYTHLDVYKRQVYKFSFIIPQCTMNDTNKLLKISIALAIVNIVLQIFL